MAVKKWLLLVSIAFLSVSAYAQKGVNKALEAAVERQVVNRAKLPTMRDGVRNLLSHRLGAARPMPGVLCQCSVRSVLNFGAPLQAQQARVTDLPRIVGKRHEERRGGFYSVVAPGSGNVEAIALPAYALIKQVAVAQSVSLKERNIYLKMAEALDNGFAMSEDGKWQLTRGYSFAQHHQLIAYFKQQWPEYSKAYGGAENPLSKGLQTALDVLDIQAWMLAHNGKFPVRQTSAAQAELEQTFDDLMNDIATKPEVAKDPSVQGAMQHLVHLRAAAKGAIKPSEVIMAVLRRVENGGRIPGSSLAQVSMQEKVLIHELNYVEQLRRANLLYILVPMQQQQDVLALRLKDFQEQGYIYKQMIKIIPEFANDGVTLNVPTRSADGWEVALNEWKHTRAAAGLSQRPRAWIAGRYGLPVNFNDLTADEKTEVLLGTYLRIKDK